MDYKGFSSDDEKRWEFEKERRLTRKHSLYLMAFVAGLGLAFSYILLNY